MKRVRIGAVVLDILRGHGVPVFNLRLGIEEPKTVHPDIQMVLETGRLDVSTSNMEPFLFHHALFEAFRDDSTILFVHPHIGPVIEIREPERLVRVVLSESAWRKTDSPARQIIAPALVATLAPFGIRAMHAAAVELNSEGILIAGASGAGKTSAVLHALNLGAEYLADDLVFLEVREEANDVIAWGMGEPPRAMQDVWERYPQFSLSHIEKDGKSAVESDTLNWIPETKVKSMVLLRKGLGDGTIRNEGIRLTDVLELTYHSDSKTLALQQLSNVLHRVSSTEILREKFSKLLAFR